MVSISATTRLQIYCNQMVAQQLFSLEYVPETSAQNKSADEIGAWEVSNNERSHNRLKLLSVRKMRTSTTD